MLVSCAFIVLAAASSAFAEWDVDGLEELLPRSATQAELLILEGWKLSPGKTLVDPPPVAPIRNCAEWEPCTGVLIRYPLGLPYGLLTDFDDDVILHVIVASGSYATAVSNFVANGVDTSRVEWLIAASNSIWTRDYGPWWVFDGNGDIGLIDHQYNRPRPQDDAINGLFGAQQGIPVYFHGMAHTGGNYMTDGAHIGMSTDLVYDEALSYDGMTPAQVDQLMEDYLGITTYNVVDDISSSGIHHIDTWAKFLDEENVLMKRVWTSHSTYAALEQRATLIASLQASTGRNYRVHRVYCYQMGSGEPAAYTNSLILNHKIYAPTFGNATYDNQAIAAYQAAAPGYAVEGYYYSGFLTDDALHCRAMGVADRGMLRVEHVPIAGVQTGPVPVSALIDDRSETGITAAELHYRFTGGGWQTVSMSPTGGDTYQAEIPNPPESTSVDYYIHAADASGRAEGMPRVEPAAWYTFPIRHGVDTDVLAGVPGPVRLHPNAPNPFNPSTTFRFDLKYPERVELFVYDSGGRLVRRLVEGERAAGSHEAVWDGTDDAGREVASGVYFYRLRAAGIAYARPAVLVR
jgi:agmatine/peptidylarginine deiminase